MNADLNSRAAESAPVYDRSRTVGTLSVPLVDRSCQIQTVCSIYGLFPFQRADYDVRDVFALFALGYQRPRPVNR